MSRQIIIGGFYKHFKGKIYQVKSIAYHSETKEKMVVYQAMYGDFSVYVRPYDMFMSEVDHDKYPEVKQKFRFEEVTLSSENMPHVKTETDNRIYNKTDVETDNKTGVETDVKTDNITQDKYKLETDNNIENNLDEEQVNPYLMLFLDADDYTEKLNVLTLCKDKIDDNVIDAMAASLEIEVPEGTVEQRFISLKNCIRTHLRFEGTRLR